MSKKIKYSSREFLFDNPENLATIAFYIAEYDKNSDVEAWIEIHDNNGGRATLSFALNDWLSGDEEFDEYYKTGLKATASLKEKIRKFESVLKGSFNRCKKSKMKKDKAEAKAKSKSKAKAKIRWAPVIRGSPLYIYL